MNIAVVIPAFNEAQTIAQVVTHTLTYAKTVIVVDDGSTDGTTEQIIHLPITLLRHEQNQGKAAALWHGMQYALTQDCCSVLTLDADGQHVPENIPRLIQKSLEYPDKLIIGARFLKTDDAPPLRRFANRFADFWISWAAGYWILDSQSGLRIYPATLLRQVKIPHDSAHSFVFESEILIEAARLGFTSLPVFIDAIYDPSHRASHYRATRDTLRITRMVTWKLLKRGLHPMGFVHALHTLYLKKHSLDNILSRT